MRSFITILSLLIIATHGWSQVKQPVFIGDASWIRSSTQNGPDSLPVTVKKYRMIKKVFPNNSKTVFQQKIDPETKILKTGPVVPVTETVRFTGKKLSPPQILEAPALQIRDNAAFNVSYSDNEHGFPGNNTTDFAEDDNHHIWIGSDKGLFRYDGYHYFMYTQKNGLPEELPVTLYYDNHKRLWLGTEKGVYFIQHDSIFSLRSNEIDFSTISVVKVQADRFQRIWLSTKTKGAICIDGSTINVYDTRCGLPTNYMMATHFDKKGKLVLATHDDGLIIVQPDTIRQLFNRPSKAGVSRFLSIYENEEGVWVGGFYKSVTRMGLNDTIQYSTDGKFEETVYDIKKAPGNGVWLCVFGRFVAYLNKTTLLTIDPGKGLLNRHCLYLFEDSFQNVWVTSLITGFSRINENNFMLQGYENPAIGFIKAILPDNKQGKWILTDGIGLVYQKGNSATLFTYYEHNFQPFENIVSGFLNEDGSIWRTSYGQGMVLVKGDYYYAYHFSDFFEHQILTATKKDGNNKVWFCPTDFGVVMYAQNLFWHYTTASGLLSNKVKNLFLDAENKVVLAFAEGLQRFSNPGFETLFIANAPLKEFVNSLYVTTNKTTLVATDFGGLFIIDNNKAYQLTTKEGLSSNTVTTIIQDAKGKIWISTDKGVESFVITGHHIQEHMVYNEANGRYIGSGKDVFLDSTGVPFWGNETKKIVPNNIFSAEKISPLFSINEVLIDNKVIEPGQPIHILPNQKININYTTIFWGRENNLKIKYILITNQGDTIERAVENKGNIMVNDVLPGSYRFLLTAKDNNNTYYSPQIQLRVNNFWYNTWLFRLSALVLLIGGIIFYFRDKSKRQEKINDLLEIKVAEQTQQLKEEKEEILKNYQVIDLQNKEKDTLIQEINHRVKNNLQIITAMVEMQINSDNKKDAEQSLRGTARRLSAMSLVHEMLYENKNVQGLSLKKYFEELVDHLKEMASNAESPVHFDLATEDIIIDSRSAISLGMIISELVSNSLKHAFQNVPSPKLTVNLTRDPANGYLRLLVGDNGNGIAESDDLKKGLGSRLVDIFSRQLEGTYTVDSIDHFVFILHFKPPGT